MEWKTYILHDTKLLHMKRYYPVMLLLISDEGQEVVKDCFGGDTSFKRLCTQINKDDTSTGEPRSKREHREGCCLNSSSICAYLSGLKTGMGIV